MSAVVRFGLSACIPTYLVSGRPERKPADSKTPVASRQWSAILPKSFPIAALRASINFKDSLYRDSDLPAQFVNVTSDCRIFYTPAMLRNVTQLWRTVAEIGWGGDGEGIDVGRCVRGSAREGDGGSTGSGGAGSPRTGGADGLVRPFGFGACFVAVVGLVIFLSMALGSDIFF